MVSEDMLQEGYEPLWSKSPGRDDLGIIKSLGANSVRLYHSIGLQGRGWHGAFLDRADELKLSVMPGYHTYDAVYGGCPQWDCYETWRSNTLKAFDNGFTRNGEWHPAVSMLMLFNEPDFFRGYGRTAPLKALVSALDGVLAAEREAGIKPGRVKLSVAWSCAPDTSLDGKVTGLAVWAWQDTATCIEDPSMVHYKPRSSQADMVAAFRTRWVHGINVQTPGITKYMQEHYKRKEPWFIGEYGANNVASKAITDELRDMDKIAQDPANAFAGMAFFQFQTAYFKGGSEMNFGMFRLGSKELNVTGEICDKGHGCEKWPVYCLTTDKGDLPDIVAGRAEAVASAWGGAVDYSQMC